MKSRFIVCGVIGMLLASVFNSNAQTTLTLQDAVRHALANSENIKKAQLDIEHGLQVVQETRARALPQINGIVNLTANPIVQQFVLPGEAFGGEPGTFIALKAGQTWNAMSMLQVQQQVFNQQVFTGLKATKSSADFYNLLKEVSEENVIEQVATNYYQVLLNQHNLGLIDNNIDRVNNLQKVLQGLFDNGLGKKIDIDRIKVNRVNLETQKTQLENAIRLQKNVLKYSMAMPIDQEIIIPDEEISKIEMRISALTMDPTIDVENISGIRVLRKQEELLGLNRDAMRAAFYPTAAITGQFILNSQSNKFNLYTGNALNFNMANIALGINIPIFDGKARKSKVEQAKIEILKNDEDISSTTRVLKMAYQNAKLQIRNSLETIQNQTANLQLAEEVYEDTNANFKLGLIGLTDLLNAESELTNTQNAYTQALLQFKVSEIEFIKAKGQIRTLAGY